MGGKLKISIQARDSRPVPTINADGRSGAQVQRAATLGQAVSTTSTQSRRMLHFASLLKPFAAPALAISLAACGGGGDGLPCGGASTLSVDLTYEVDGALVDPMRVVLLTRGVPVQATPRALRLPAACAGEARWTFVSRTAVPAGLAFDSATGTITGTPGVLALFEVDLKLEINGYPDQIQRTLSFLM